MDENINSRELTAKAVYDIKLVNRALRDADQKAYAELMERYRESVYFMLLKMVNNKEDADDLTIEAFGKAFKRLHQYTPEYAFSTWLFKIATNNCIDFMRNKRKKNLLSIDRTIKNDEGGEMQMEVKADEPDPEDSMVKKQKVEALRAVVEKLKPRYRALIEKRYFEEKSYEEISEEMEIPLGTVKAQLFRARDFLQNILKNAEGKI
jgi:RNA polymerase sigma-70 factor (ECF subfamily)